MKVLIFTTASPFHEITGALAGGAEYALRSVAENLVTSGCEVHYVTTDESNRKAKRHDLNGLKIHVLPWKFRLRAHRGPLAQLFFKILNRLICLYDNRGGQRNLLRRRMCQLAEFFRYARGDHASLKYMQKLHLDQKFDIIHCYSSPPDIHIARILKEKYDLPYTVRMGGRFYYNCFKDQSGDRRKNYVDALRSSFEKADFFAFNSKSLFEQSERYFSEMKIPFPSNRCSVLDIGVDIKQIESALRQTEGKRGPGSKKIGIACIGKFKAGSKRQDLLLEVLKAIKDGRSPLKIDDIHVYFAGGGDLLPESIRMAKKFGIFENCTFYGSVPKKKVYQLLKDCDFFMLPTEFEGSSKALAEALLAGTAVLASDIPPNRELLDAARAGLLFENSVDDLLKKLNYAFVNRNEMKEAASQGRSFVLENLNPEIQVGKYRDLFCQILGFPQKT